MQQSISKKVEEFIYPIITALGYDLIEVQYVKKQNGMNLTVFIDSSNGISLNDCEKVHNAINDPLDELNPTNDASYTLNVSSVGLDRPFKSENDYKRNIGQEIELSLYSKIDGNKNYVGKLLSTYEDKITILYKGKNITFEKNLISKATKYISF